MTRHQPIPGGSGNAIPGIVTGMGADLCCLFLSSTSSVEVANWWHLGIREDEEYCSTDRHMTGPLSAPCHIGTHAIHGARMSCV